jgi:tyrosinase
LDDLTGIDMLGNIVEASDLSINQNVYGQLHNCGHDIISYIHDPDYRHLEDYGVMGDVATAVRDPIFYRWHSFIDGIFQKHKAKVTKYGAAQLEYDQVTVSSVEMKMLKGTNPVPNNLLTFWSKSEVDLQAGMDFNSQQGSVFAEFEHLNHAPFVYNINVENTR